MKAHNSLPESGRHHLPELPGPASVAPLVLLLPAQVRQHLSLAVRRYVALLRQNNEPVDAPVMAALRQFSVIASQGCSAPHELPEIRHIESVAPLLVDCAEAARLLAISESGVRRLVRNQQLQAVRVGGSPRYRIADLNAYVDALPTQDSDPDRTEQESA